MCVHLVTPKLKSSQGRHAPFGTVQGFLKKQRQMIELPQGSLKGISGEGQIQQIGTRQRYQHKQTKHATKKKGHKRNKRSTTIANAQQTQTAAANQPAYKQKGSSNTKRNHFGYGEWRRCEC